MTPAGPGTSSTNPPTVDQFAAVLDSNAGNGDWLLLARPPIARYAYVGDVLELTVRNDTEAVHPYHLHGFSMQPVRMVDNASGLPLYEFDYDEFVDTVDVYGGQSFVFRVRLDERAKFCDLSPSFPPGPSGAGRPSRHDSVRRSRRPMVVPLPYRRSRRLWHDQ